MNDLDQLRADREARSLVLGAIEPGGLSQSPDQITRIAAPVAHAPKTLSDPVGLPGDLDLASESIDLVLAAGWCERTAFFRWSLQEIARVLKPGGLALVCLPETSGGAALAMASTGSGLLGRLRNLLRPVPPRRIANPQAVMEELGLETLEAGAPENYDVTARGPQLGQDKTVAYLCRKRTSGWRNDPLLRNRAALEAAMRRDYQPGLEALGRFEAEQGHSRASGAKLATSLPGRNALVLSPHPDDELIGCGGALLQLRDQGGAATILQASNGWNAHALYGVPDSIRRTVRLEESRRVAEALDATLEAWDDVFDGAFEPLDTLTARLLDLLERTQPDMVFTPFVDDPHPDHVAVNAILADALKRWRAPAGCRILSYEVWSFCPYNLALDIADQSDEKLGLLGLYRSALRSVNYARVMQWFGAWHSFQAFDASGQREVFLSQTVEDYLAMTGKALPSTAGTL